ncbi:uncharacterized protein LOC136074199 [Hydra vulgaris]|uniref:Uncharacterized protein LOC136074199 n=1 Tax=Hydra vulgaris TaxID=6087 RepID=A0ABM4B1A3_HYDVU
MAVLLILLNVPLSSTLLLLLFVYLGHEESLNDIFILVFNFGNCNEAEESFEEFNRILVEQVSPDWKRFARNTFETNIYSIIDQIDQDNESDKSKMEAFLQLLYKINPTHYKDVIVNSLYALNRIDVVLGVVIDENFEKLSYILVKRLSNDWKAFARWFNINDISTIVETIDQDNNCDSIKMESFLEIIFQRFPLDYKDEIARSLNLSGRLDILYGVVLDESSSLSDSLQEILVQRVSPDWRRFARHTDLPDIDNIVENIDGDLNNDQSKMAAIFNKLKQLCPLNYKDLIEHSLNMTNRFDVLLELQFDRQSESFKKILLKHLSSDWKNFAQRTCLFEVDYVIEHIDHDFKDDCLKLMEFLKKLFEIDPVHYKQIIKNSLAKLKRFSVLQRLKSEDKDDSDDDESDDGIEQKYQKQLLKKDESDDSIEQKYQKQLLKKDESDDGIKQKYQKQLLKKDESDDSIEQKYQKQLLKKEI